MTKLLSGAITTVILIAAAIVATAGIFIGSILAMIAAAHVIWWGFNLLA